MNNDSKEHPYAKVKLDIPVDIKGKADIVFFPEDIPGGRGLREGKIAIVHKTRSMEEAQEMVVKDRDDNLIIGIPHFTADSLEISRYSNSSSGWVRQQLPNGTYTIIGAVVANGWKLEDGSYTIQSIISFMKYNDPKRVDGKALVGLRLPKPFVYCQLSIIWRANAIGFSCVHLNP